MAGEVVGILLGDLQTVTGEDESGGDFFFVRIAAGGEEEVIAGGEGFRFTVTDERGEGIFFDDLALDEFHGLIEAVRAGGFDAIFLELFDDVDLGTAEAGTAGFATFHVVVGEDFDVVPPGFSVEVRLRRSLCKDRKSEKRNCGDSKSSNHTAHEKGPLWKNLKRKITWCG